MGKGDFPLWSCAFINPSPEAWPTHRVPSPFLVLCGVSLTMSPCGTILSPSEAHTQEARESGLACALLIGRWGPRTKPVTVYRPSWPSTDPGRSSPLSPVFLFLGHPGEDNGAGTRGQNN